MSASPIIREVTVGDCRLIQGDCLSIMPLLGNVDSVVTDPPYGISHASNYGASWQGKQIASDQDTSARDIVAGVFEGLPCVFFGTWKTPPVKNARGCVVWDKGQRSEWAIWPFLSSRLLSWHIFAVKGGAASVGKGLFVGLFRLHGNPTQTCRRVSVASILIKSLFG